MNSKWQELKEYFNALTERDFAKKEMLAGNFECGGSSHESHIKIQYMTVTYIITIEQPETPHAVVGSYKSPDPKFWLKITKNGEVPRTQRISAVFNIMFPDWKSVCRAISIVGLAINKDLAEEKILNEEVPIIEDFIFPLMEDDIQANLTALGESKLRVHGGNVFFWGGTCLSNWHKSKFVYLHPLSEVDDDLSMETFEYTSAEQFMMIAKALAFKDYNSVRAMMRVNDVDRLKKMGRAVKGYDDKEWASIRREEVLIGCHMKFKQNPEMAKVLLATGDLELVEASPYDKIWGIGMQAFDPNILDKSVWGENLLGKVLMDVRDLLRSGE